MKHKNLPSWDLSDFYTSLEDTQISKDCAEAEKRASAFKKSYESKLHALTGQELFDAIQEYEQIEEVLGKLISFAYLKFAEDMSNEKSANFLQFIKEKITDVSNDLLFFSLDLNAIPEETLQKKLSESKDLTTYFPWLETVRRFKPFQLSKDVERALQEKTIISSNWVRLYDETSATLKFSINGEEKGISEVLNCLTSPDENVRQTAYEAFTKVFSQKITLFSLITNTLSKDLGIDIKMRGYKTPISQRNLVNNVEDETVSLLMETCREEYQNLSHRYYDLKRRWMGKEKLEVWDRNAPLPDTAPRTYSWEEASKIVCQSYEDFHPKMGVLSKLFFDNPWIDAALREGKDSGAFSHPTIPSKHPYILMNFQGKIRDVATLAHEVGHGIHQCLSNDQGLLMSQTPLTLAETASVFGEMLTFQSILKTIEDPKDQKVLLAGKVEDMLSTVIRQVAFCSFEIALHNARQEKELSAAEIGELFYETQKESLGPAFDIPESYKVLWAYIPHFIHSPFYVYAYAFGDCLVNSLYMCYTEGLEGFEEKYIDLLRAGGSKSYADLLAGFGLNPKTKAFWKKGLSLLSAFIDQLEELEYGRNPQ